MHSRDACELFIEREHKPVPAPVVRTRAPRQYQPCSKKQTKKVKSLKRERVRVEHAHLLVKGEHVHGGFGLLALARGRQKLVAHVQEEAVARVEPQSAAAAVTHDEALHSARRRARLHQERPADAQ